MKGKGIIVILLLVLLAAPMAVFAADAAPQDVVKGNNRFAFELYKKLGKEKQGSNMFFSPFSISTALAMTYAASKGETEKEMAKVLHYPYPQDRTHKPFSSVITDLNNRSKKGAYQLSVANRIWYQQGSAINKDFSKIIAISYQGGFEALNLQGQSEKSRVTINDWVAQKTNDKIQNLIPPGAINSETRMVLTNAIYFKGKWVSAFEKKDTKKNTFFRLDGKKSTADFMYQKNHFQYGETATYQALMLPYQPKNANELALVVLLPKKVNGLPALESKITADEYSKMVKSMGSAEVMVYLPRFKMTTDFSLKKVLSEMGMKRPFGEGGQADFTRSGLIMSISAILHKAFVDVNEEGTEAAAATAVIMADECVRATPQPKIFKADHPFIFTILDRKTGSILFMGRMMDPAK